ncbi:MAG: hypothetical protein GHCLOJNM_02850 [bacterium]|nr:hypothetical protein [bacterium]
MRIGFSIGLFKMFLEGGKDDLLIPEETVRKMGEHLSVLRIEAKEEGARLQEIRMGAKRAAKKIGHWGKQSTGFPGGPPVDLAKMRQRYETILAPFSLTGNQLQERAALHLLDLLMQHAIVRKSGKQISRSAACDCLFRLLEAIETPKRYRGPHEWHTPYSKESLIQRLIRNQPKAWAKLRNRNPLKWDDFNPPVEIVGLETEGETVKLTFRSGIGPWVSLSKPEKAAKKSGRATKKKAG